MLILLVLACDPAPGFTLVSASEQGLLQRSDAIQGRDGGPSALAFGVSVWTFGDTVLDAPDEDGVQWHTNSMQYAARDGWQRGFETPTDSVGVPDYFIELKDQERAWNDLHGPDQCEEQPCSSSWSLWPSPPLYDEENDRAWILYGLHNEYLLSGVGVASWDGLDQPVVRHLMGGDWLLFPEPQAEWANAPVVHQGHIYAFGCVPDGLSRPCGVGRVPLDAVDQRGAWRFFDGANWVSDEASAATLFKGAPIMSVSFNQALEAWLLVYSEPFSQAVVARTAPEIVGPWSQEETLFEVAGEAPYDVVHHGELEEQSGRVQWLSYSQPNGEGWFGADHHLWRVELAPR